MPIWDKLLFALLLWSYLCPGDSAVRFGDSIVLYAIQSIRVTKTWRFGFSYPYSIAARSGEPYS